MNDLHSLITQFAPTASRFLEWDGGETTSVLCKIAETRDNPLVFSIFHDHDAIISISKKMLNYSFLHLRQFDLRDNGFFLTNPSSSYATYPAYLGLFFDVAVIGTRQRLECLVSALSVVSERGVVLMRKDSSENYGILASFLKLVHESEQFLVFKVTGTKQPAPPRPEEKRIIVVPVRGEKARRELAITLPSLQAYAARIGANCIVTGEESALPPCRLKAAALDVIAGYDRIMLLDADILIRDGAPDLFSIVPATSLGAFPEGRFYRRTDWCETATKLYGLEHPLNVDEYFNSGVLVLSSAHASLLRALRDDEIWAHPQFEQSFLNAKRAAFDIPLFQITPDFNYQPDDNFFPDDWRHAFFFHIAGCRRNARLHQELWQDQMGDMRTFALRAITSSDVRHLRLKEVSYQMSGRDIFIYSPTDFHYFDDLACPIFTSSGEIVVLFKDIPLEKAGSVSLYGPYITLLPGRYRIDFQTLDSAPFLYPGAMIDVVGDFGHRQIVTRRDWPEDGSFTFKLEELVENVEIRIHIARYSVGLAKIIVERITAGTDHAEIFYSTATEEIRPAEFNALVATA